MIRYCFHLVIYEAVDFSKLGSDSIYYDQNIVHNITKIVLFSFAVIFNISCKYTVNQQLKWL